MNGRGHRKWILPNGMKYTLPSTPSDGRGMTNNLADLRRALRLGAGDPDSPIAPLRTEIRFNNPASKTGK
jgi:hypothetical protein